jgi:hypothetical protein
MLLNTALVALVSRADEPEPDWISFDVSALRRLARLLVNPFVVTMRSLGIYVRGECVPCVSVPRDTARSFTILTGSTLPETKDGGRSYELDMITNLQQYATMHGYEFVNASDEMIALHRSRTTAVHWLKPRIIANALDRAQDSTWVVWFDTDLLITNRARTLEALVNDAPPSTLLMWSRDNEGLNAGALFWRANNASRQLARDWLAEESRGAPTDQKGLRVVMLRRAGVDPVRGRALRRSRLHAAQSRSRRLSRGARLSLQRCALAAQCCSMVARRFCDSHVRMVGGAQKMVLATNGARTLAADRVSFLKVFLFCVSERDAFKIKFMPWPLSPCRAAS